MKFSKNRKIKTNKKFSWLKSTCHLQGKSISLSSGFYRLPAILGLRTLPPPKKPLIQHLQNLLSVWTCCPPSHLHLRHPAHLGRHLRGEKSSLWFRAVSQTPWGCCFILSIPWDVDDSTDSGDWEWLIWEIITPSTKAKAWETNQTLGDKIKSWSQSQIWDSVPAKPVTEVYDF